MARRKYRMRARRTATDRTRATIVRAARRLLSAPDGIEAFTIDAVARAAGVARMTIYHQLGSKTGVIEAVFDSLAIVREGVPRLLAALGLPDRQKALAAFVETLAEAWQVDRLVIRRLQGLAAIDPEVERAWHGRQERRREGLRVIASRFRPRRRRRPRSQDDDLRMNVLCAILAFETYDVIAGPRHRLETIVPVIYRLALQALA
jgi:AcrR family transcriptional regulator